MATAQKRTPLLRTMTITAVTVIQRRIDEWKSKHDEITRERKRQKVKQRSSEMCMRAHQEERQKRQQRDLKNS